MRYIRAVMFWLGVAVVAEDGLGHSLSLFMTVNERINLAARTHIWFFWPSFPTWWHYNLYWAAVHLVAAAFIVIGRRA